MPTICSLSFLAFLNPAIHVLCLRFKSFCCASVCPVQCATITAALKAKELKGQWSVCTFRSRITTGYSYIYERGRGDEYFLSLEVKTQKSEAGTLHSVVSVGLGIIRSLENSSIRKDGMWSRVSPLLVHIVWTTTASGSSSGTEAVQVQITALKYLRHGVEVRRDRQRSYLSFITDVTMEAGDRLQEWKVSSTRRESKIVRYMSLHNWQT